MSPLVSVVIAVRNGEPYIAETLGSLTAQTLCNWECFVVDDGSTDRTPSIVKEYAAHDSRVRLISTAGGLGPYRAANLALPRCTGEFIARSDADDISLPERLATQISFLHHRPEVQLCGSFYKSLQNNVVAIRTFEYSPDFLRWQLLFRNRLIHSTMMMRLRWFQAAGWYAPERNGEDYAIWCRAALENTLAIIPEPLLLWRIHDRSVTHTEGAAETDAAARVSCRYLKDLLGFDTDYALVRSIWWGNRRHMFHDPTLLRAAIELVIRVADSYLATQNVTNRTRRIIDAHTKEQIGVLLRVNARTHAGHVVSSLLRAASMAPGLLLTRQPAASMLAVFGIRP